MAVGTKKSLQYEAPSLYQFGLPCSLLDRSTECEAKSVYCY